MYIRFWASLALSVTFAPMGLSTDLFFHSLPGVPKSASESCEAKGEQLAHLFETQAGSKLYSWTIEKQGPEQCSFKFYYVASNRMETSSTIDRNDLNSPAYQGYFENQTKCEAGLARESEMFVKYTGLKPWIGYCLKEERGAGQAKYLPFVEGLGSAISKLYSSNSRISHTPTEGWGQVIAQIAAKPKTQNLALITAGVGQDLGATLNVRYYSNRRFFLTFASGGAFEEFSYCEKQLGRIRESLDKEASPHFEVLSVNCALGWDQRKELLLTLLYDNIENGFPYQVVPDPKSYSSFEDCMSALPDTESFYKLTLSQPVSGGFCSGGKSRFQVFLLKRNDPPKLSFVSR